MAHIGVARACFLFVLNAALLSACTASGFSEFQLYAKAYDAQYEQGDAILILLAKAERQNFYNGQPSRGIIEPFKPEDSAYYVDTVEPPITASIRSSLLVLKDYNDALTALGNGESAAAFADRLNTLAANIAGTAEAFILASKTPVPLQGSQVFLTKANKYLADALPVIKEAATAASREAFRQSIIRTHADMRGLLTEVITGTPTMFQVLKYSYAGPKPSLRTQGVSEAAQAELEKERTQLSAWVLLMNRSLVALDAAARAASTRSNSADLASLSNAAVEMRVLAEQIKSARTK